MNSGTEVYIKDASIAIFSAVCLPSQTAYPTLKPVIDQVLEKEEVKMNLSAPPSRTLGQGANE